MKLVSVDRRRGRIRLTRLGLMASVIIAALALGLIAFGVRHIVLGQGVRALSTPVPVSIAGSSVKAGAEAGECPRDPTQWRLMPYELPAPQGKQTLYALHPPCVMEQAEQVFIEYMNARAEKGRHWTTQDQERFYTTSGYVTPLGKQEVASIVEGVVSCSESVKEDGSPVTGDDFHAVFYTASPNATVADLLIIGPAVPGYYREYDCQTGELLTEQYLDGSEVMFILQPVLYENGRWRMGYTFDSFERISANEIKAEETVNMILEAQGRR